VTLCSQETALWNSNKPTGAIVYIDIPVDDGVVICSEFHSDYWQFMTLEAPGAGNHPISGTRQFGIEPNSSGGYNIYVRGVDRFESNIQENASYMASFVAGDPQNPFFAADNLWESFQSKINNFVISNAGASSINEPIKNRPDWSVIQEVLKGERPVSDIVHIPAISDTQS
jgi:hypothetical protein